MSPVVQNILTQLYTWSPIGWLLNGKGNIDALIKLFGGDVAGFFDRTGDNPINPVDYAESWLNSETGAGMTQAQVQQNEYTASREDTMYQRGVADMQAAGLNPAMMYSNGGSSYPSSPSASPSSAGLSFSDLIAMIQLPAQLGLIGAETDKVVADTAKTNQETEGASLDNQFKSSTLEARAEGVRLSNSLRTSQIAQIDKQLDEISANIHKLEEEAATEESRRELNFANSLLSRVNAQTAIELLPYTQALQEAQTDAQRNYAALMAVQTLYQKHLISDGYLDAVISQMKASATSVEASAAVDKIKSDIRTGKFGNDGSFIGKLGSSALSGVVLALDELKGLFSVGIHFGKSFNKSQSNANVNPGFSHDPFGYLNGE